MFLGGAAGITLKEWDWDSLRSHGIDQTDHITVLICLNPPLPIDTVNHVATLPVLNE